MQEVREIHHWNKSIAQMTPHSVGLADQSNYDTQNRCSIDFHCRTSNLWHCNQISHNEIHIPSWLKGRTKHVCLHSFGRLKWLTMKWELTLHHQYEPYSTKNEHLLTSANDHKVPPQNRTSQILFQIGKLQNFRSLQGSFCVVELGEKTRKNPIRFPGVISISWHKSPSVLPFVVQMWKNSNYFNSALIID